MRTATPAERLYTSGQSTQIAGQTGCIGHLRADMGEDGKGFFKTWKDHRENLSTEEFQQEFESVLNALVGDEQYGGFLKSRDAMRDFCQERPESGFNDGFAFGFRADTAQYAYLIRLQPYKGEENLFIYCYRRDWLDSHMKQAEKGIRFITPDGKEKFRVPDGGNIRVFTNGGTARDHTVRYIDHSHLELLDEWGKVYSIREYAERLEQTGGRVIPLRPGLPEKCYAVLPSSNEIITIKHGEDGYFHTDKYGHDRAHAQAIVDEYNGQLNVTKAQAAAMLAGSMFGWEVPAADPKNYDKQGQPIKPKHHDRGDAR